MRIFAFLFPSKYPDAAYQLKQSKIAFICGDWFGVGLGHSMQKQLYLPEAHTDFIFAILGEELGFVATLVVASLFAAFLILGMRISLAAKDRYGQLLGFAITLMIALQATINIGVVVGWLPTKGLALPFISYGGSALLVALMGVGILLNISLHADSLWEDDHTRVFRDRTHTFHE
jgi:cell division protein FtsW